MMKTHEVKSHDDIQVPCDAIRKATNERCGIVYVNDKGASVVAFCAGKLIPLSFDEILVIEEADDEDI